VSHKGPTALAGAGRQSDAAIACEWAPFRILTAEGPKYRYRSCWRSWGIHHCTDKWYSVTHLPLGHQVMHFDRSRIVRRFCEAIDSLTDWSDEDVEDADDLALAIHRTALRVTGSQSALTCVNGGTLEKRRSQVASHRMPRPRPLGATGRLPGR
jgi:hypothetical protein